MNHTISIDDEQLEQLSLYCAVCGRTLEEAIREALDDFLPIVASGRIEKARQQLTI